MFVSCVLRAVVLAIVWIALSGGDTDYAWYGVFSVVITTAFSLWLVPPRETITRLREWPRRTLAVSVLAGWFLGQSVKGGVDVARRALRRDVDIDPAVVETHFSIEEPRARNLAVTMMNLMPGALVQEVTGDGLLIHTIARDLGPERQWEGLQRRIAPVFS